MRCRLRSIYTPSPLPGLTLPPRQLSRRRGPAPRSAPPRGVHPRPAANQGPRSCPRARAFREVPSRRRGPAELRPCVRSCDWRIDAPASSGRTIERGAAASVLSVVGRFEGPRARGSSGPAGTGAEAGSRSREVEAALGGVCAGGQLSQASRAPGDSPGGRAPLHACASSGLPLKSLRVVAVPGGGRTQTFVSRGPFGDRDGGPVRVTIADSQQNHLIPFLGVPPLGPAGAWTHRTGMPGAARVSQWESGPASPAHGAQSYRDRKPPAVLPLLDPWILPTGDTVPYRGLWFKASAPSLHSQGSTLAPLP